MEMIQLRVENTIFGLKWPKMPKIGLDHGSFGLESDAPMGGEYLGTIRTIPDGI